MRNIGSVHIIKREECKMPRSICDRCKVNEASNVTVEIRRQSYRLCEKCFREYLKVDAADKTKQDEFIRGGSPDSLLGKLRYWIKRIARTIAYK